MKTSYLHLSIVLLLSIQLAFSQDTSEALLNPNHIQNHIFYQEKYPFIAYHKNFIQWNDVSAISNFLEKLPKSSTEKVKILHIGDSHVQFDMVSGTVRNRLQQTFGYGGRGLVFPLNITHTNPPFDYRSSHRGAWTYSKNVHRRQSHEIGVSGVTISTKDPRAGFRLHFADNVIKDKFRKIKVLAKNSPKSFAIELRFSDNHEPILLEFSDSNNLSQEIILPIATQDLDFQIVKQNEEQSYFELYGIVIENIDESGVLYSSTGINGAGYHHVAFQKLLPIQIKELNPDLIVLDLGTNDFRFGKIYPEQIRSYVYRLLDSIRIYAPQTNILLTNTQDFFRGRRDVLECKIYAKLIKEIALEKNCAFYDFYEVSGGEASMLHWRANELSQRDLLHLSVKGYKVKGEIYANAILNSYHTYLKNPTSRFILENPELDTLSLPELIVKKDNQLKEKVQDVAKLTATAPTAKKEVKEHKEQKEMPKMGKITYTIKNGDNLGFIAEKFHVSIKELRSWNNLRNDRIFYGDKIVIYLDKTKAPQNTVIQTVSYNKSVKSKTIIHKVRRGDSLWKLAKKYDTTVDLILKNNKLASDDLQLGQELIIKK